MANNHLSEVLQHVRRTLIRQEETGLTDGQLLEAFLNHRDNATLEALFRRHSRMVWGVCCRILHNHHDAEDAFQATFLILIRKAASIVRRETLVSWLYGVAHRTALDAKIMADKRKKRERQVREMPEAPAAQCDLWTDLQPLLDHELSCLPDKYRVVLLLCDLEGRTRKEAAKQLKLAEGTVASRLARARRMLAKRLGRRGLAVSGVILATVLSEQARSVCVPGSVLSSAIRAGKFVASGHAVTAGVISARTALLTEGVLKSMLLSKLKAMVMLMVLALGLPTSTCIVVSLSQGSYQAEKQTNAVTLSSGVVAPARVESKAKAGVDQHGDPLPVGALARLGTIRWRHGADVKFVAFGLDGKTLITAGQDNTIRLWDLAAGKEIRRFAPLKPADRFWSISATGWISPAVALAPDGKMLAASTGDVIQLWDVQTGKELRQFQLPSVGLGSLLFSPDSRTLAARSVNDAFFLWSVDTGKVIHQIKPPPSQRNTVCYNVNHNGDAVFPPMTFTPDGKTLVVATIFDLKDKPAIAVQFWDVASGKQTRRDKTLQNLQGLRASAVALSPDGKLLAVVGGESGSIYLCQADTGEEIRRMETTDGDVDALAFSPDGKTLAVHAGNQRIHLWQTDTGKKLHQLDAKVVKGSSGLMTWFTKGEGILTPEIRCLAFSPDVKQIAAAAGPTVRLWVTATGKERSLVGGHREAVSTIALSRDGKTVVSWGADQVIRRWEAATGKALGTFPAPSGTIGAAFSCDARTIALGNRDDTIRLYETSTGKELRRLKGNPNGIADLAFTSDGTMLASRGAKENSIRLYDLARGSELREITLRSSGEVRVSEVGLAFSPDGKLLVVPIPGTKVSPATLVFFNVTTGKQVRTIEPSQSITTGVAFSPDSRVLATENADGTIILWEVASGKKRGQLGKPADKSRTIFSGGYQVGIGERPTALTFSPDGQMLATRGPDRSTHDVWDVFTGKEIGKFKGHQGRIETLAFAADGKSLASSSTDTTILLWDATRLRKDLPKPQTVELPDAQVGALWSGLAGSDVAKAFQDILQLANAPKQALPFLGLRLKPVAAVDPQQINRWIADLENEKFAVRKEADAHLQKARELAVPALRKVLASSPPLETRKRVEALLEQVFSAPLSDEQLRLVRAVEALERMNVPESRQLLRTLARGASEALLTQEAQAALDRLAKRPASSSVEIQSPE